MRDARPLPDQERLIVQHVPLPTAPDFEVSHHWTRCDHTVRGA